MSNEIEITVLNDSTLNKKEKSQNFRVITSKDEKGDESKIIEFHNIELRDFLKGFIRLEGMYDNIPKIEIYLLVNCIAEIKRVSERYEKTPLTAKLVKFLVKESKWNTHRFDNMFKDNLISFNLLEHLFTVDTEIVINDNNENFGGKILKTEYKSSFFGTFFCITYEYISSNGQSFLKSKNEVKISHWSGITEIKNLDVKPITSDIKAELGKLGELYAKVAIGSNYVNYKGPMYIKSWWKWSAVRADGRIMADISTCAQFLDEYHDGHDENTNSTELDPNLYWMADRYVRGFSFAIKQWGKFSIRQISEIQFKDQAFNQLVLDQDKKDLIKALVTNTSGNFEDIISGKGGGCIFLLHGEPGVGKTLTAEAIAELLHRPLYSVSVGQLGVGPDELEKNLRQILDVAQIWNAVILIDEADIFLEKRGHDIVRNAMCGVFLRLLEYHQGVLFLTTNRVGEFDPAFYSRISIALKYGALDASARKTIWTNLLVAANIAGLDPTELARTEINGRQIKTTIRLAQGLAHQQGVPVNNSHVYQTLKISQQFLEDLGEKTK